MEHYSENIRMGREIFCLTVCFGGVCIGEGGGSLLVPFFPLSFYSMLPFFFRFNLPCHIFP